MSDHDCVAFLQWALPHLKLRWPGFRKVRGQVCKRLKRRMRELNVVGFTAYRDYIYENPEEWLAVDSYCRITISRFCRDKGLFQRLGNTVLPSLAVRAAKEGRRVRCWSIGCASGEEVYSLKMVWEQSVRQKAPDVALSIVGTDIDETVLQRARMGCYQQPTLRELPPNWIKQCFDVVDSQYCVNGAYRAGVSFQWQDIRKTAPLGRFDFILCRNLIFTYFLPELQEKAFDRVTRHLLTGGFVVIGAHERLPLSAVDCHPLPGCAEILQWRPDNPR